MAIATVETGIVVILGFVIIPLWLAMGLADYFCHRQSLIEKTSGTPESVMHLAQFGLVGLPVTAALFFDINAGMLAAMALIVVAHHAIAYVDVRYANASRDVRPVEQMIHSFLELLPITAFLLVAALRFDQTLALLGMGHAVAEFSPRLREPALPVWYIASVLVGRFSSTSYLTLRSFFAA